MQILPALLSDSYKQFHHLMYPENMVTLYSNGTPRSLKYIGTDKAVFFGLQYYMKEYLIGQWNDNFFKKPIEDVVKEYKRFHKHFSGRDVTTKHLEDLHALGYLPLIIKALPEGAQVKAKIPYYTIRNTKKGFGWLVNFLETQMSTVIWNYSVVATLGYKYRQILNKWAIKTTGSTAGVEWQGHDFSMRGISSVESTFCNAAWLLSFNGTDTIPAVLALEEYYNANIETELVGASVPATEHSVMTSYGKENEIDAFRRIMNIFPSGILSVVSDSFDLWKVCTEFMMELKKEILARDGKLVIRPDSGDPVDIICGIESWKTIHYGENHYWKSSDGGLPSDMEKHKIKNPEAEFKGVIELLWDVFGGTINEQGYKVLDPHIGAIYGDSITALRAEEICARLEAKGFASTNIVLGVGSFTIQYNTRDSIGFAVKSTQCQVAVTDEEISTDMFKISKTINREIFKDPITDDGTKKSAKGLLAIFSEDGEYVLKDQCTDEEEASGELKPVFENGILLQDWTLQQVREKLNS